MELNPPPRRPTARKVGPPPLQDRINALTAAAIFVAALIIGAGWESIAGVYTRGPCAVLCVIALTVAMYYPAKAMDEARARGEDENDSFRS